MVAVALALLLVSPEDVTVGPPIPPQAQTETTVAAPPMAEAAPAEAPKETPRPAALIEERAPSRKLQDGPEPGPALGGFLVWTGVVMLLLVGVFLLLRRFGRNSRFLTGGGVIRVLARKPLAQKQEVFLVEVGAKVFLIGSTRDRLATLGEFSNPDDVATLRANLPRRAEDSMKATFRDSLREGLREEEKPPESGVYASIAEELTEIRKTVHAWRA